MKNQAALITQPPAVAGLFYPAEPQALRQDVDRLLRQVRPEKSKKEARDERIKALIAPHAGYTYSGAIAATAYARLKYQANEIRRVVIFAPAHRLSFRGLVTASADQLQTPLGVIPVDKSGRRQLLARGGSMQILDEAFCDEHALEVQLPFLQRMLDEFEVLPILVGDADPVEVQEVMNQCWGGPESLIVVSSDLSHFHDYATAERLDYRTTACIEALQPEGVGYGDACGRIPVNGLLRTAREKSLRVETVAQCNSGDTGGDRQSVVGYGAYVFT